MTDALHARDEAPGAREPTLLCVDDEPNILSSLRRLFRGRGYRVLSADSAAAGLRVLETEPVDLVISDMRMPEMNGARFLELVRASWPDTVRLLLTGHADIGSIADAINRGEIYRYITKPWDDNDIILIVRHALERRALELEKQGLEALTQRQNEELTMLNLSLEAKVEARTRELTKANQAMLSANEKLKSNFITTIKIFSSMIDMRGGNLAGHARRVADLARKIALKMGQDARQTQEVFIAALLHDVGKIGFSDEMLALPASMMAGDSLGQFRKHPVRAEQLLMPLEDLRGVAAILRAHMERFDGSGFPNALAGLAIPTGARILALASDFDNLQIGALVSRRLPPEAARQLIYDGSARRYDPVVVGAFRQIMEGDAPEAVRETELQSGDLVPGMVLSRDLVSRDGLMLLSGDHRMDQRMIRQVQDFEAKGEGRLNIWVRLGKGT